MLTEEAKKIIRSILGESCWVVLDNDIVALKIDAVFYKQASLPEECFIVRFNNPSQPEFPLSDCFGTFNEALEEIQRRYDTRITELKQSGFYRVPSTISVTDGSCIIEGATEQGCGSKLHGEPQ